VIWGGHNREKDLLDHFLPWNVQYPCGKVGLSGAGHISWSGKTSVSVMSFYAALTFLCQTMHG
jgi:hypothetical protein